MATFQHTTWGRHIADSVSCTRDQVSILLVYKKVCVCVSVRDYTSVLYEHVIATAMVNASIISDASVGSSDCEHICNNSVHGALGPCDSHETHQPSMLPKPIPRDFTVCCRSCIGHTSMSTRCMNTYGLSDDHTEHCCSIA